MPIEYRVHVGLHGYDLAQRQQPHQDEIPSRLQKIVIFKSVQGCNTGDAR